MDGRQELDTLAQGLRHPLPQPDSVKSSKIESAVWKSAIEALENRFLLANALMNNVWMEQPLDRRHQIKEDAPPLTLHDVQQMTLLLDGFIIKQSSQPKEILLPFSLTKTLERLIRFKLALNTEPSCRMIFHSALQGLRTGERQSITGIYALPRDNGKMRMWYRYYGIYSGLLRLVTMQGKAIDDLTFDPNWLNEDDGIVMMLACYAIQSGRDKDTLMTLHHKASRLTELIPSAQSLLSALNALKIRAQKSAERHTGV